MKPTYIVAVEPTDTVVIEPTYELSKAVKSAIGMIEEVCPAISDMIEESRAKYGKRPLHWRFTVKIIQYCLIPGLQKMQKLLTTVYGEVISDSDEESERKLGHRRVQELFSQSAAAVEKGNMVLESISKYKRDVAEKERVAAEQKSKEDEMWAGTLVGMIVFLQDRK